MAVPLYAHLSSFKSGSTCKKGSGVDNGCEHTPQVEAPYCALYLWPPLALQDKHQGVSMTITYWQNPQNEAVRLFCDQLNSCKSGSICQERAGLD